ncbi:MAG TPA: rhodanese-like domain-containing protein [Acidimicrobiales bacterium]|jgi:rhodanese-related sulfurtransferase|nr:sulfurtransferase [Actinomycetota bacterium]MDP6062016.1 rhodanese-like domain-containing protein [Acidimicrobiales bacterium]HJL89348.1 rhodanese-like domain-containing protein [Acidimicrobiales bacterium]HJP00109.1 rhodanese-like domain-containing protein [Acidimicrobiales bacterium]|tara:strand:+ start:17751 stop:18332 length:582 start_codon:yes stop_codon:yes gene_type:complete
MEITRVNAHELKNQLQNGPAVTLVDVRTSAEYETRHIAGSVHLPLDLLAGRCEQFAEAIGPIVLVCESGQRATQAGERLAAAGCRTASVLDGGVIAWNEAGGDLVLGKSRWAMDRQVRFTAGLLLVVGFALNTVVSGFWVLSLLIGAALATTAALNICPMAVMLGMLPYNRGSSVDADGAAQVIRVASSTAGA